MSAWSLTTRDLSDDLRRLVLAFDVDPVILERVRKELPAKMREARVVFKDYPLMLGVETAAIDNPGASRFNNFPDCFDVNSNGDARERDAINFPQQSLIKVSRVRFNCYATQSDRMRRLVLHEYLGLIGVEDSDYGFSNSLLKAFQLIHRFDGGLRINYVSTCEEFEKIGVEGKIEGAGLQISTPIETYQLTSDVDCAGYPFRVSNGDFVHRSLQANLDGNGYAVRGLNMTGGLDRRAAVSIFETNCSHCVIANIRFEGAVVEGDAGLILRNAGTIANLSFSGLVKPNYIYFGGIREKREAGGLVKENLGTIRDSDFEITMNDSRAQWGALSSSRWTGGLVGSNFGSIRNVHAKTTIEGVGYLGGLTAGNWGLISDSKLDMSITGKFVVAAGGLTAMNRGQINEVEVDGFIQVQDASAQVGRLVGAISDFLAEDLMSPQPLPFDFAIDAANANVHVCKTGGARKFVREPAGPNLEVPKIGRPGGPVPFCGGDQ